MVRKPDINVFAQNFEKLAEPEVYQLHRANSDAEMIYQSYLKASEAN